MTSKKILLMLTVVLTLVLAGCTAPQDADVPGAVDPTDSATRAYGSAAIDVDLTLLSETMVSAELTSILSNPTEYIGKRIKMKGLYYSDYYDETDKNYHFVIFTDNTACCSYDLEFIREGDYIYPDDYPENETDIEVVGVLNSYEELGQTYHYISVEEFKVI